MSAAASGVIHSSSVEQDHDEELSNRRKEMQGEIAKLNDQVDSLQSDLDAASTEIDELEKEKKLAEEARDQITASWRCIIFSRYFLSLKTFIRVFLIKYSYFL